MPQKNGGRGGGEGREKSATSYHIKIIIISKQYTFTPLCAACIKRKKCNSRLSIC